MNITQPQHPQPMRLADQPESELKAARELAAKHAEDAQRLSSRVNALEREVATLKKRIAEVTDL